MTALAEDILDVAGALKTDGHYVYASGRHGSAYVAKKRAIEDPKLLRLLCREIAGRYVMSDIEAVVGPETGGAKIAEVVAEELGRRIGRTVPWAAAKKQSDGGIEVVGADIARVKYLRTLIVDDILTTGSSLKKVVESSERIGCRIVAVCVLVNRGGVTARAVSASPKVNLHLDALVTMSLESWPADGCPLCKAGVPVNVDLGHGGKTA